MQIEYLGRISDYKNRIDSSRFETLGETKREDYKYLPSGVMVPKFVYPTQWYREHNGDLYLK